MSLLKVARMGHPVLRTRAREIERAELKQASMQKLIDDMIDTMHEYHGVGLAAPQIHEGLRIFVAAIAPENEDPLSPDDEPMVFINPVITPAGPEIVEDWEGCLSIPDIRGRVPRARAIRVVAMDRSGGKIDIASQDFPARVIQHETDHLDGVLFFDRMRSFTTLTYWRSTRYWAKERTEKSELEDREIEDGIGRFQAIFPIVQSANELLSGAFARPPVPPSGAPARPLSDRHSSSHLR